MNWFFIIYGPHIENNKKYILGAWGPSIIIVDPSCFSAIILPTCKVRY